MALGQINIGIMTINGFEYHPNARFREEAVKSGHRIMLIDPYNMGCTLDPKGPGVFMDLDSEIPDLVMPRQGSPMGEYGFVLLRQFIALGIPLVNSIEGVTIARNQFISLQQLSLAGVAVPQSIFVTRENRFFSAVQRLGGFPVVAKQVDGMGGDGVVMLNTRKEAQVFLETGLIPRKGIVVQAFINPRNRTDLRVLIIGGRVAGVMALTPAPGQFKANIHQQAKARPFDLPESLNRMAVAAARACRLDIAGVDMMVCPDHGAVVSEVNYSPGFRGLEQATGMNIAGMILDHVVRSLRVPDNKDNK